MQWSFKTKFKTNDGLSCIKNKKIGSERTKLSLSFHFYVALMAFMELERTHGLKTNFISYDQTTVSI